MLPALAFPFLAEVTSGSLDASNPTVFLGLLIGGLITLAIGIDKVDNMVQRRRRQPSVDVDLSGLRADIQTLNASVAELKSAKEHHNGHRERIVELERRCQSLDAELAREMSTHRSHVAKLTKDIFDRIEGVEKSVATNFQTVERGLGRVEGALELIAKNQS